MRIDIELLFRTVEEELARRWVIKDLPTIFLVNPPTAIRTLIKACWQLYHESICAAEEVDRTVWKQPEFDAPMAVMNTSALLVGLEQIHRSINLGALLAYRPLLQPEYAAVTLLVMVTKFYVNKENLYDRSWTQIL
jgi:hypothetical protein